VVIKFITISHFADFFLSALIRSRRRSFIIAQMQKRCERANDLDSSVVINNNNNRYLVVMHLRAIACVRSVLSDVWPR